MQVTWVDMVCNMSKLMGAHVVTLAGMLRTVAASTCSYERVGM
jgi:hypothetical protein